ncbi:MAG: amphi-Trp domain-containing protein [Desulfobacterales bacterium]|jgi:amphi-Trp domain-containing protein|nr:amphi-Trp domain-containing protein [Desulfobacterales bacterium]
MPKAEKDRDIEQGHTTSQMVGKLRRLADCIEQRKQFRIQIAGEMVMVPSDAAFNIEHEREGNLEEVRFQFKWRIG